MKAPNSSRRNFLKTTAWAVSGPLLIPSNALGADAPSKKITMGFIGMGKQNQGLLGGFMGRKEVQVLAVCDVDTTRREAAKARVNEHYSKDAAAGAKGCEAYVDYRELLARKDIDAVCIATPDHWHAVITVEAIKAGKDVYCEKPLTHNVHESVMVMEAVAKTGRILQTGSMQRSSGEFRTAAELVINGVIGKIKSVECQFGGPPRPHDFEEEEMEKGLDWDRWVGPAPVAKYNSILSPRGNHNHFPKWREVSEYGGGYVTDWGAHHLDIAQWGLGMDDSGPVKVTCPAGTVEKIAAKQNNNVDGCVLTYASGITVTHKLGGYGVHFVGEKGEVKVNRGKFEVILDGNVFAKKSGQEDKMSVESQYNKAQKELLADARVRLYDSKNHLGDFLGAVASRKKPICHEVVGGRTAIVCHLMNIAYRTGKSFAWDPAKNNFAGSEIPASELTRAYRGDWKV